MRMFVFAACSALLLGGCSGNDCVANEVGQCNSSASTASDPPSPGLAAYGLKPSGAHISLDCRPYNVPAFARHDCLYSHWHAASEPIDCTLKMADRYGLVVGEAMKVQFESEAGAVSPLAVSPAFDPAKPASDQKSIGHAVGFLEVFGAPLPSDVPPLPGEKSQQVDFGCGMRTANPRDGMVTVIAYVPGEEGFADLNRNGQYDPGEPFVDLGEPFVDANDNGTWDPGEWYADVNGDGAYTPPNGVWDADTIIWTEARVLYTGLPWFGSDQRGELFSRYYQTGTPPDPTPPADLTLDLFVGDPAVLYPAFLSDAMLNPLTPLATYDVSNMTGAAEAKLVDVTNEYSGSNGFRLLYCNAPASANPTECHDGPVETACRTAPCYVVPEVGLCRTGNCSGLVYGTDAAVRILPGTLASGPRDVVDFKITIDDIVTWMPGIVVNLSP